jgi:hypothetical protein
VTRQSAGLTRRSAASTMLSSEPTSAATVPEESGCATGITGMNKKSGDMKYSLVGRDAETTGMGPRPRSGGLRTAGAHGQSMSEGEPLPIVHSWAWAIRYRPSLNLRSQTRNFF